MSTATQEIEEKEVQDLPDASAQPEPQPGRLEVDVSEDSDDDEPEAAAAPQDKKSRRRHYRELKTELQKEREARANLEREIAEMRGRISAVQAMPRVIPQAAPEADPLEAEIDSVRDQQQGILAQLRSEGLAPEQREKLERQFYSLDRKRIGLIAKAEAGPVAPQQSREDVENQILASEFPDVFGSRVRLMEARAELVRLMDERKMPLSLATARLAAKTVQERYSRKPSPPSPADAAKHAGIPGRAGAHGGGTKFVPDARQLRAARAFTSHLEGLSDEQRVKIWYDKVGKKHGLIK